MRSRQTKIYLSLDLEEDYAGQIVNQYEAVSEAHFLELKKYLVSENIPLSIFVQGKLLDKPQFAFIKKWRSPQVEFFLHSYKHDYREQHKEKDLLKGIAAFTKFFGKPPSAYRAPEGRISLNELKFLKKHHFDFDSSLLPTLLPKPKYFLFAKLFEHNPYLPEIPMSDLCLNLIPFSLSWMKLIGKNAFESIFFLYHYIGRYDTMVFNFHMHDLWKVDSFERLPLFWKFIYARNRDNGFKFLKKFIADAKNNGVQFGLLSELTQ